MKILTFVAGIALALGGIASSVPADAQRPGYGENRGRPGYDRRDDRRHYNNRRDNRRYHRNDRRARNFRSNCRVVYRDHRRVQVCR